MTNIVGGAANPLSPGEAVREAIVRDLKDLGLEPDARDEALLGSVVAMKDRIATLEAAVNAGGLTYVDREGIERPSPLLAEIRLATAVMARCLRGINMEVPRSKDAAKSRAGQASWAARRGQGNAIIGPSG